MTPFQQMLLGTGGAAAEKTYIENVFSTYVYRGNAGTQAINNGIDLSDEDGMVWIKRLDGTNGHRITDTVRGANKELFPSEAAGEATETNCLTAFNNNGFTLGDSDYYNGGPNDKLSSWTWRKTPGFFDIVQYEGNGSDRTIAHSLGCVPGCIMIKRTDAAEDWAVWHRGIYDMNTSNALTLNEPNTVEASSSYFTTTAPTSTHFSVGTSGRVNGSSNPTRKYIAYIFAGGASAASTAYSMNWDAGGDMLNIGTSSSKTADFNFGTGALTIECWFKAEATQTDKPQLISVGEDEEADSFQLRWDHEDHANKISFLLDNFNGSSPALSSSTKAFNGDGQWHHVAVTRNSNMWTLWVDGLYEDSRTWTGDTSGGNDQWCTIGNSTNSNSNVSYFNGRISNVRIVKGTAVYTSSFKPPTTPLTNITNTKLLCCNDSSRTGSTVTPLTITESGISNPTQDSPFDDPAGFVFGKSRDQSVIKCGSYIGDGNTNADGGGFEVNLGWEPQYVLVKKANGSEDWHILDIMRGLAHGEGDKELHANDDTAEQSFTDGGGNYLDMTPTGFTVNTSNDGVNTNGKTYIYLAIRRSDGYVGKPAEAGTDVFTMDTGNSSSTIPTFDSGFPVDFAMYRIFDSSSTNWATTRLNGTNELKTADTVAQASYSGNTWNSNVGWCKNGNSTTSQSWMWKRSSSFDVVNYKGDNRANGRQIPHSLSKTPEMIWIKKKNATGEWIVGHHGVNGGSNPWEYEMLLHTDDDQGDSSNKFNDTAPTSTHFTVGNSTSVNALNDQYIALLFASTDVSKTGYYTGNASGNLSLTDQLDWNPRFFMCKSTSAETGWLYVDSLRDVNLGKRLFLNSNAAQTTYDAVWAMGRTLESNKPGLSEDGEKYIFYAHK